MNDCEEILKKANETQENAAKVIMEVQKMKESVSAQSGVQIDDSEKTIMIPYSALEMEADRHDAEKDKMRKHYKSIIMWISVAFVTFVLLVFGSIWYLFANYDFTTYSQDGNGINNYLGENAQQGDLNYGAENPHNTTPIQKT